MRFVPQFWHEWAFPAGIVLDLFIVAACLAGRFGRIGAVVLGAVSILWLLTNKSLEGGTIMILGSTHGVNTTDLAGVLGLGYAIWLWFAPAPRE